MAKIPFELASGHLQVGQAQPLQYTQFSTANAMALRAPQISMGAGNINYTPVKPPEIIVDKSLDALAGVSSVLVQSALKIQDSEAQAVADENILKINSKLNELLVEYKSKLGQEGSQGYKAFASSVNSLIHETISQQDPQVRGKMAIPAFKLQDAVLTQGSEHKVAQHQVWQGNILKRQGQAVKANIFVHNANDRPKMYAEMQGHLNRIDEIYAGQPQLAEYQKQEFVTSMFNDIIDFNIDSENFSDVPYYIQDGLTMGADPNVIAVKAHKYSSRLTESINRREANDNNLFTQQKRAEITVAETALGNAVKYDDPSYIENADIRQSIKMTYMDYYSKRNMGPASTNTSLMEMARVWGQVANDPYYLLDDANFPGLSAEDRLKYHRLALSDYNAGIGNYRSQAYRWIDTLFPSTVGTMGKLRSQAIENDMSEMKDVIDSYINEAKTKGTSIAQAIFKAKNDIMSTPRFFSEYENAEIDMTNIRSIGDKVTKPFAMLSLQNPNVPIDMHKQLLDTALHEAKHNLWDKYGLPRNTDPETALSVLRSDPGAIENFWQDVISLKTLYRYRMQQVDMRAKYGAGTIK